MKRIALVLGCYGLMVGSAAATERWSAETCKHLQEMKAFIRSQKADEYYKATQVWPVLIFERTRCTVAVQGEVDAVGALLEAGDPALKQTPRKPTAPGVQLRQPYGGSKTDCF
jgi:hypothetical protein